MMSRQQRRKRQAAEMQLESPPKHQPRLVFILQIHHLKIKVQEEVLDEAETLYHQQWVYLCFDVVS